ncbi:MAG TPA: glycosyltransferase family 4 protein [Thermoguttaceae bacterium]
MKVLCLIDSVGSGGAQRQLCTLAVLMKRRGIDVSMLTYYPYDFFLPILQHEGIEYKCIENRSIAGRILALRSELRRGTQDVVLAFLDGPNLYAELASIPRRKWGLVVSERSAVPGSYRGRRRWWRMLHRLTDYVTTNSHTNRLMIERSVPRMIGRVITVYNVIDLETFYPLPDPLPTKESSIRLLAVASFRGLKNPLGFIKALAMARGQEPAFDICLDWYGRLPDRKYDAPDHDLYNAVIALIEKQGLQDKVRFHPPSNDILALYRRSDVVVLPSFYEGLSNVVCEAMACGRPVLASNVSDIGNLVKDGYNGYLFEPTSIDDMTQAILRFAKLSAADRESLGQRGRQMAQRMFNPETVVNRYVEILTAAAAREHVYIEHWVPEVPDSTYRSLI